MVLPVLASAGPYKQRINEALDALDDGRVALKKSSAGCRTAMAQNCHLVDRQNSFKLRALHLLERQGAGEEAAGTRAAAGGGGLGLGKFACPPLIDTADLHGGPGDELIIGLPCHDVGTPLIRTFGF